MPKIKAVEQADCSNGVAPGELEGEYKARLYTGLNATSARFGCHMDTSSANELSTAISAPRSSLGVVTGSFTLEHVGLELHPPLVEAWLGSSFPTDGAAVVTMGWLGPTAILAVLLTSGRELAALVLDPAEPLVAAAVEQWSRRQKLPLTLHQDGRRCSADVDVHVDGSVRAFVSFPSSHLGRADFQSAVAIYADVERLLSRLAGTHRLKWAVSGPIAAAVGAH